MVAALFLLSTFLTAATARFTRFGGPIQPSTADYPGLSDQDCNIRCPLSNDPAQVILPSIVSRLNASGEYENVLECWKVDTVSTNMPGVDNSYRLDWEGGFDGGYQYIFYGESFMQAHSTPEPSLIVVGGGIGELKMPNGQCLKIQGGDNFFSVGTKGKMTAWWAPGTVVSDFYFKDGLIPSHDTVPELNGKSSQAKPEEKVSRLQYQRMEF